MSSTAFFGDNGLIIGLAATGLAVAKYEVIAFVCCEAAIDELIFRALFARNFLGSDSMSRCFCSHSSTRAGTPSLTMVSGSHIFSKFRGSHGAAFGLGLDVFTAGSAGSFSGSFPSIGASMSSSAASPIAWTYSGLSASSSMFRPTMSAGTAAIRNSGMPSLTKCILRSRMAALDDRVVFSLPRSNR